MLSNILLTFHLCASLVWVGAVFMGTFIDWPACKESMKQGKFPFKFVIAQAKRVFFSVYGGITILWFSGIGLTLLHPPQSTRELSMLAMKFIALSIMSAFTLYGTFSTWPKMQLATHEEAFELYRYYMYRACTVFILGILASVLGLWLYP